MAESEGVDQRSNGAPGDGGGGVARPIKIEFDPDTPSGGETLYSVICDFVAGVASPPPPSLLQRLRSSAAKAAPRLREASRISVRDLLLWTRRGGPLRALFVISVGTISLLALTGLLSFIIFLFVATLNAVIVSLLMSLAAAGGFLAVFFACLTAIYIGAVSFAIFIISTATISAIIAIIIATGWIGFFWIIWLAVKKSLDLTKRSVGMTSSAISAYSAARQTNQNRRVESKE
ncbi:unnamed protein product [Musa acuminata subsp. burmannicoides]